MSKPKTYYTHWGFFGLCPVFVDPECEGLDAVPVSKALNWLYRLSEALQVLAMDLTGNFGWTCTIMGELKRPVIR